ncbi:alpha/beta hydrolase [Mycolicibacterium austroafricanum]|uniref:Alpha/beta hydrolase n=1 Tax=Mycolicibacterium austroafricanum TaxID=39687 RepID=A0ABT8HN68_MYCAO|nr:alpha/beta hydrolase [Mycolicibacterium austroafricanum]MDN4522207.1 alpha/beta hydrolase [Mycolicibacterium austroafricanum]QRZ05805.1 alpha/beta hydrolase [Mycolicibacterium austroafricanum]QZT67361.1 alpha/beta hydrolase [Mycolicibacterium austroafricanum]
MTDQPPPIDGVRRHFVTARGVNFHVTEAGPEDGRPVLALHGWPQHHWVYRSLLADPPTSAGASSRLPEPGLRIIAPDLPGYGWSGPAPHKWAKEDVVSDLVALMDAMGLDRVLLIGHDWGGYIGHLLAMRVPERIDGYLALNIAHPWVPPKVMAPHLWRFLQYQPLVAFAGVPLQRHTSFLKRAYKLAAPKLDPQTVRVYSERFRDPVVARTARDTYRTFLLREAPAAIRNGERRRSKVPTRALFGRDDTAIHPSLAAAETARADDYTIDVVDGGHFILDDQPELVRAKLIALAEEFPAR